MALPADDCQLQECSVMDFNAISTAALGIGALLGGVGYAYGKFYEGKNKQSKDTLDMGSETLSYFKAQIEGLQNLAKEQKEEIAGLNNKISKWAGVMQEKDKQIEEYKAIFQNRDPEMVTLLKEVSHTNTEMVKLMQDVRDVLHSGPIIPSTIIENKQTIV